MDKEHGFDLSADSAFAAPTSMHISIVLKPGETKYIGIPISDLTYLGQFVASLALVFERRSGWTDAEGFRQPPMYFPSGGSTIRGISKPGPVVWSRVFIEDGCLKMDIGRANAINLPREETERRWNATTPQWPIMHVFRKVDGEIYPVRCTRGSCCCAEKCPGTGRKTKMIFFIFSDFSTIFT